MPDTNKTMVKFKYGSYEGFKGLTSYEAGTIYVTTDEQGLYFAKDNVNAPIKLGNIITYDSLSDFNENTQPPYSADVFYYITNGNMLFKYNASTGKFVQLNKDYGEDVADIKEVIGADTDETTADTLWGQIKKAQGAAADAQSKADEGFNKATANAGEITTIKGNITTIGGQITGLDNRLTPVETAITTGENNLGALRQAINDNATNIGTNATAISELTTELASVKTTAEQGVTDAATAKGVADAAKTLAEENKAAITGDNGLNALKGRIDGLDTDVASLGTEDARLAEAIADVEGKVNANTAEFAKYYTAEEIDEIIDSLTGTGEDGDVTSIAGLKIYVDEEVERVEGVIAGVDSKVDNLATQIDNVANIMNFRGVVDSFEKVTDPKAGDVVIKDSVEYVYVETVTEDGVSGAWEAFGAATATETRFQGIETRLDTAEGKITTAEGEIDTLQTDVSDLKTTVNSHTTKIATIESNITTLDGKIDGVADDLATEAERADAAEKALDKKITDLDTAYKAKDGELASSIAGVRTDFEAADVTINGKIDGLTTRLNALDTAETGKVPVLEAGLAAEIERAKKAEGDLDTAYKAADAETKSYIDNALAWGTF